MIPLIVCTIAAAIIFCNGLFCVINNMTHYTATGMRLSWVFLTTGAFGYLLSPIFCARAPSLPEMLLLIGVAGHVIYDKRRRRRRKDMYDFWRLDEF